MTIKEFFKKITGNPNGKDVREWSNGSIAFQSAYSVYNVSEKEILTIPEVYSAIDMLANDISKAMFWEKKVSYIDNNKIRSLQHVQNSKWDVLLNRNPNEYMSKNELIRSSVFDLFLRGGFYWFIDVDKKGKPKEIIPIDPNNIRQIKDEDGKWGYELTTWMGMSKSIDIIPYDCIIAVNYSNITNVNDGDFRYIYQSLLQQFGLKNKYDTSQLNRNSTMLAHAKVPTNITVEQSNAIKANFRDFFSSSDNNTSGVLVTDPKVEVVLLDGNKTSIKSPVDKEFVLSLMTKLANAFHIPLPKLNISSSGQSFYKSREGINIDYLNDAIEPWLNVITSKINHVVFGSNMKREIVSDMSSMLDYDTATKGEYTSKMRQNGIFTTNELRKLNGLPPVEDGDKIYGNGTLIELGQTQNTESEGKEDEEK